MVLLVSSVVLMFGLVMLMVGLSVGLVVGASLGFVVWGLRSFLVVLMVGFFVGLVVVFFPGFLLGILLQMAQQVGLLLHMLQGTKLNTSK